MSFNIIVDSCCDLTPAHMKEGPFTRVPLTLRVGDTQIVDDAFFDQADLLWRMKESASAPQTACPSPAQYMDAFDCGADDLYAVSYTHLDVYKRQGHADVGGGGPPG